MRAAADDYERERERCSEMSCARARRWLGCCSIAIARNYGTFSTTDITELGGLRLFLNREALKIAAYRQIKS